MPAIAKVAGRQPAVIVVGIAIASGLRSVGTRNHERAAMRLSILFLLLAAACASASSPPRFAVIVSANAEGRAVKQIFPNVPIEKSPFGEYLRHRSGAREGIVFHGVWGKVDAAASAQYVIAGSRR